MATTPTPYYSSEFGAGNPVTPLLPEERNDVVEGQGHAKTRSCAYPLLDTWVDEIMIFTPTSPKGHQKSILCQILKANFTPLSTNSYHKYVLDHFVEK